MHPESSPRKIVLLPGMDGTGTLFDPFVAHLPAHLEAQPIAFPNDQPPSFAELAQFVLARLPASESFSLLAESFSTPLAVQIASTQPAGLKALILVAGFVTNPSYTWVPRIAPLLLRGRMRLPAFLIRRVLVGPSSPHALVREVARAISSLPPDVFAARLTSIAHCDARSQLSQVAVPILCLQANQDRLVPPRCLEEILAIKPDTAVVGIDGPHLLLQRQPRKAAEAIADFLRRTRCGRVVPNVVPYSLASSKKILDAMRREPRNVRFADLFKVCVEHFGEPRQSGTSHAIFKTPWQGDPRINIQNDRGKAKAYQVRQVLLAIKRLREAEHEAHNSQEPAN